MGEVGTDNAYRGTVNLEAIIGYNGAWDKSWGTPGDRTAYAGRDKYYTVFKITIGSDYNQYTGSGWIALCANLLSNENTQTNYNRTLSYGLSTTAPTPNNSTVGFPSSFIGGEHSATFTVNNQSGDSWFQIGSPSNPINFSGGTTYYLWVWSTSSSQIGQFYKGLSHYKASAAMFAYEKCTAPTSFVITSKDIIKYNTSIKLSWSGAGSGRGNSISGYIIYWRFGAKPSISDYNDSKTIYTSSTSYSININPFTSSSYRGKKVYFGILTMGSAGSKYYSELRRPDEYVTCNSLPILSTPTVSSNKLPSSGSKDITFYLNSSDVDGQTRTYEWSSDGTNYTSLGTNSSYTLKIGSSGTYYFRASDGLEKSGAKSVSIIRNTKPDILSISTDSLIQTNNYLTGGNIKVKINKNEKGRSCKCEFCKQGSTSPFITLNNYSSYSNSTFTFNINTSSSLFTNITEDIENYYIKVTYIDDLGESDESSISIINNKILGSNTIKNFTFDYNILSDIESQYEDLYEEYFNKQFYVTIKPGLDENNEEKSIDFIKSKKLFINQNPEDFNFKTQKIITYGNNGEKVILKLQLTDLYNRTKDDYPTSSIIKIIPLTYKAENDTTVMSNMDFDSFYRDNTEEPIEVTVSMNVSSILFNGQSIDENNIKYLKQCEFIFPSNKTVQAKSIIKEDGSTFVATFKTEDFYRVWDELYVLESQLGNNVTLTPKIKITDIFGYSVDKLAIKDSNNKVNILIIYDNPPSFEEKRDISFLHEPIFYPSVKAVNKIITLDNIPEEEIKVTKINEGEVLIIKHHIAKDLNIKDQLEYKINANINNNNISIFDTNNYLEYCNSFEKNDYKYHIFLVSNILQVYTLTKIEITVKDTKNNSDVISKSFSEEDGTAYYLCPIDDFAFNCNSCQFNDETANLLLTAKFNVDNISGYSLYSNYENLERTDAERQTNLEKSKLEIYYSEDLYNFPSEPIINLNIYSDFEVDSLSNLNSKLILTNYNTNQETQTKGYFYFKLILNYGTEYYELSDGTFNTRNCEKDASSNIFFFENLEPTVSYRQNCVSINHKVRDKDLIKNEENIEGELYQSAFSVYSTTDHSKIYLINNEDSSQKIIINLLDGSIDGAIIDGGKDAWNNLTS